MRAGLRFLFFCQFFLGLGVVQAVVPSARFPRPPGPACGDSLTELGSDFQSEGLKKSILHLPEATQKLLPHDDLEASHRRIEELAERLPEGKHSVERQRVELRELRRQRRLGQLRDPNKIEKLAALELRELRSPPTRTLVPPKTLLAQLNHSDPEKRFQAVARLRQRHDPSLSEHFLRMTEDVDLSVRSQARQALIELGAPFPKNGAYLVDLRNALIKFKVESRRWNDTRNEIFRLNDEHLQRLLNDINPKVTSVAAEALEQGRSLEFISRFLGSQYPSALRAKAVDALQSQIYDPEVLPVLQKAMKDPDPTIREKIVEFVALNPNPQWRSLIETAEKDSRPQIRAKAAFVHDLIIKEPWVSDEWVLERLTDKSEKLRREAVEWLWSRGSDVIETALKSDDMKVRTEAVKALRGRTDARSLHLLELASHDPVYDVQREAFHAATMSKNPVTDRIIRAGAYSPSDAVREDVSHFLNLGSRDSFRATEREMVRASQKTRLQEQMRQAHRAENQEAARIDYDADAFAAAKNVYGVPEYNKASTADALFKQQEHFLDSVPIGYEVKGTYADPLSGLKIAYYQPARGFEGRPHILALAGTQNTTDILADFNLGEAQRKNRHFDQLVREVIDDLGRKRNVTVTGHSLGGGLAQAVAYEVQNEMLRRNKVGPEAGQIRMVSFNAFGAKELVDRTSEFRPEVAQHMDAVNYRLKGDPISRVGTHIGELRELPTPAPLRLISNHRIEALEDVINFDEGLTKSVPVRKKPLRFLTSMTAHVGVLTDKLLRRRFQRDGLQMLKTLCEAQIKWIKNEGYRSTGTPWLDLEIGHLRDAMTGTDRAAAIALIMNHVHERSRILTELRRSPAAPSVRADAFRIVPNGEGASEAGSSTSPSAN